MSDQEQAVKTLQAKLKDDLEQAAQLVCVVASESGGAPVYCVGLECGYFQDPDLCHILKETNK